MDRRYTQKSDCRAAEDGGMISGYAAVFYDADDRGTEYELPSFGEDRVVERIKPGAFDRAISEDDVRALFNHDPDNIIGRTAADTLRLTVDDRGLNYSIDPPDTQLGRDLRESISRGDVSGSSFAFIATDASWERDGDLTVREIRSVQLFDVGPVTYPAYEASSTMARCVEDARKEYDAWLYLQRERDASEAEERGVAQQAIAVQNYVRGLLVNPWKL